MNLRTFISALLLVTYAPISHAAFGEARLPGHEAMVSFETDVIPSYVQASKNSTISISEDRYIDGRRSLKWTWSGGPANLVIERPIPFQADAPELREMPSGSTFAVWIYNARPMDKKLRFTFGTGANNDCGFDFNLNYAGWRTGWVMFNRDMRGTPREGMDTLRINTPSGIAEGELYIDSIVLAANVDARHQYPDYQVPFVMGRDVIDKSHWLPRMDLMRQWSELPAEPSTGEARAAVDSIEQRCEVSYLTGSKPSQAHVRKLEETFNTYQIKPTPTGISGRHIAFDKQGAVLPEAARESVLSEFISVKDYQQHMLSIAKAYRQSDNRSPDKAKLRTMYLTMAKHLLDQGWAVGSCQGTVHHIGYAIRELVPATLLMRDVLAEEGLLEPMSQAILWYLNTPTILEPGGIESNMDYYNTQAPGQLMSLLIMPDGDAKVAAIKRYSGGLSKALAEEMPGTSNGFKVDGTAFHHSGHYPAYAMPAFGNTSRVIYWLSGSPFEVTTEGRSNFRRALLASRIYSNPEWGIGMSGRHPFGGRAVGANAFLLTALSGDPASNERVDREVLAAALRMSPKLAKHPDVVGLGIAPEPTPQGHWTYNYAAAGIHRYGEKMVTLKGYNKNVWASEIYTKDNRFGRYQSHGSITILNERGNAASGYAQDGWDWNRLSGTTGVHLPLDQLESPRTGTLMERSKEGFAGSSNLSGKFGTFATIIRDDWLPGSQGLLARKSAFCFEDRIVCLGTGITNPNKQYPTETTLFQNALQSGGDPIWCNSDTPITALSNDENASPDGGAVVLVDAYQNGYYLPAAQSVRISRSTQHSLHNKTKKPTQGLFAAAWIDHGPAPQDASYEYAIILDADIQAMLNFKKMMADGGAPAYQVLRQDQQAHIVHDSATNTTGIACFETTPDINQSIVRSVSRPSLIMIQERANGAARISVCSPDLNLKDNVSAPVLVSVQLDGKWSHPNHERVMSTNTDDTTTLEFTCIDGIPVEVELMRD